MRWDVRGSSRVLKVSVVVDMLWGVLQLLQLLLKWEGDQLVWEKDMKVGQGAMGNWEEHSA